MSVVVLVPTGGDDPYRSRAFDLVSDYVRLVGWPAYSIDRAEVSKPDALNAAVKLLPSAVDVIVLNDADSIVPFNQMQQAISLATEEPGIVFAYTRYRRVDKETTESLRSAFGALSVRDDQVEWEKVDSGSHGCIAIQRQCWEQVGGLDPVFATNGYEDLAFNTICEAHWPSRRISGDLFHLWHPRGWDRDAAAEATNRERYGRYLEHWGDQEALLELRHETVTT